MICKGAKNVRIPALGHFSPRQRIDRARHQNRGLVPLLHYCLARTSGMDSHVLTDLRSRVIQRHYIEIGISFAEPSDRGTRKPFRSTRGASGIGVIRLSNSKVADQHSLRNSRRPSSRYGHGPYMRHEATKSNCQDEKRLKRKWPHLTVKGS